MELTTTEHLRTMICPKCHQPLSDPAILNAETAEICPKCNSKLHLWRFQSARRSDALDAAGAIAVPGEAVCFFHAEKRAERTCDRCGRFICGLCDLPLGVRHLCPTCVSGGLDTDRVPELVTQRFIWQGLALSLGILPLLLFFLFWPLFVMTGPAAVFCGIWGWRKPGSVVRGRRRVSAALGLLGGLIQIGLLLLAGLGFSQVISRHA